MPLPGFGGGLSECAESMNKLIIANLLHRPLRSLISITAVAIEVIMILSIAGIFMGMLNDSKQRTNGVGADVMVWPSNASYFSGVSGAPMPAKNVEALRRLPHVAVATPVIQHLSTTGAIEVLWGIEYPSFNAMKPFQFIAGEPFQNPHDIIVDDVYAASKGTKVGDTLKIFDQPFRVSGIVEHGRGGRRMIPIDTMGALMGTDGKASLFYVKCDDPANTNAVVQEIESTRGFESNRVQTMQEWLTLMTPNQIPAFNTALRVVTGIAVIVGFLVIFQSMYTAVLERTREIGILKSLGSSKPSIVSIVIRETAVLAVAGVVLGILGTYGVRALLAHLYPTQQFEITSQWLIQGALIAFVGALFGALYPAWMAARKDPIDALAYE
ncbi:MAG TPA: ABC transporter permease [Terracidiphilus sp.]|nr:ABC transporter permease [Terracidiphilus sp.]